MDLVPQAVQDQQKKAKEEGTSTSTTSPAPDFLELKDVSLYLIRLFTSSSPNFSKTLMYHRDIPLKMHFNNLNVQCGVRATLTDKYGRLKINILVNIPEELCHLILNLDFLTKKKFEKCISNDIKWIPAVETTKYPNPTIKLKLPNSGTNGTVVVSTTLYRRIGLDTEQVYPVSCSAKEVEKFLCDGSTVEAVFSFEIYHHMKEAGMEAGMEFIAKTLTVLSS